MQRKIPHFEIFRANRRNFSVYLSARVPNLFHQPIGAEALEARWENPQRRKNATANDRSFDPLF
ncbi:hypothetical protein [Robertmurraya sp. P23]|uniref:hypothetical protein n=1 Tax=Robertmurraya sp. P23 TaxID=3436931 RepID=UPI003D974129